MPKVERDFEELLRLFNKHRVRYCIIGAFAVGYYAAPRYTKDLDILVEPGDHNGKRIVSALDEFGFGSLKLTPGDFTRASSIIQLGYEPVRVDLSTSISGVTFERAWKNRKIGKLGGQKAIYLSLDDLIRNKTSSARQQDLADVEVLKRARRRQ